MDRFDANSFLYITKASDYYDFCDKQEDMHLAKSLREDDELMESILENINSTPIGKVLKRIASLPETRRGKVLSVRRQITEGTYDITDRLDLALDKVLEDLTV